MSDEQYEAVDQYLAERYASGDDALTAALAANDAAHLPPIAVSATQGKLLQILAKMIGARRILEIGTLGGYPAPERNRNPDSRRQGLRRLRHRPGDRRSVGEGMRQWRSITSPSSA